MNESTTVTPKFNTKTHYVRTDGWRGYSEPIYAVFGWNDTGDWSDSPCKTAVGRREAKLAEDFLKENNISYTEVVCESSNVFCVHHYLVVMPRQVKKVRKLVSEWYNNGIKNQTRLLYII